MARDRSTLYHTDARLAAEVLGKVLWQSVCSQTDAPFSRGPQHPPLNKTKRASQ